ncbi:MAG TPA: GSCFA domain-containing protein, partial [Chryseolinea sp.]|nr:GSCFA domain-containing protein [Chryseolinea sp.]
MSHFRTIVSPSISPFKVGIKDRFITIGSCFADVIGGYLKHHKIETSANPFGTLYSPAAIHKVLSYAIFNKSLPEQTFLQNQDIHLNYDFHSEFSALQKEVLKSRLKECILKTHQFLVNSNYLIITYGSSWVYERIETGELVANCHKMPAKLFAKSLLTQKKIIESFDPLYQDLKKLNPNMKIILTVSPVRHLKDTLELNSISKSILRTACHTLTETYSNVEYFPAYEIMMDDLRDYRFYKSDMIHPSEDAEAYIWQKFVDSFMDDSTKQFFETWSGIQSALAHKP